MTQTMAASTSSPSLGTRHHPYSQPRSSVHPPPQSLRSHPPPHASSSSHQHPNAHLQLPSHPSQNQVQPKVYTTGIHELHPGPRNRLFLSLRSGLSDEVDWALPKLVQASFEHTEAFRLETWVDSVAALRFWPEKWVESLELEAAARESRKVAERASGDGQVKKTTPMTNNTLTLSNVPERTKQPQLEERAMNSLLILRNASLVSSNSKILTRVSFTTYLIRFFSLPLSFLLDLTLSQPEAFLHTLVILNQMVVHLYPSPEIFHIFGSVLPHLAVETRDMAILNAILPVLILTINIPGVPSPTPKLATHLLQLLTLTPPGQMLDLALDLLITLTLQPQQARGILASPSFPAHLKTIVSLLEREARPYTIAFDPPPAFQGKMVLNPAGATAVAENAIKRRVAQHQKDQPMMEANGGPGVTRAVGDKQPILDPATISKLYKMKEPRRSIAWMHETFVYSSSSQLLQVTFWHAYRDFFQNPATVEQLLSASEVIKNVTIAFPGAQAKIWIDERGDQKFVIAGMGFRRESAEHERYMCHWRGCTNNLGPKNPGELLSHIRSSHLSSPEEICGWSTCSHAGPTTSHVLTHLPLLPNFSPAIPDSISSHPSQTEEDIIRCFSSSPSNPLSRPIPLLPRSHPMRYTASVTPVDSRRQPTGSSFLASLVIRNLARTLRAEIPGDEGEQERQEKKKHLREERFGLPIPDSVIKEEEQEEDEMRRNARSGPVSGGGNNATGAGAELLGQSGEMFLGERERVRALRAFQQVEERVLEVVQTNVSGLPQYLAEAFGW